MDLVDALILNDLSGVGDKAIIKLINFSIEKEIDSLEALAEPGHAPFGLKSIPSSLRQFMLDKNFSSHRTKIEADLNLWKQRDISVIHFKSDSYPTPLLSLTNPPPFLFCKGNLGILANKTSIAVVGTRKNTSLGATIAIRTTKAFANQGFTIISGLALGIDTIAHQTALDENAPTIAVVVDVEKILPAKNKALASHILKKNGLLISENRPGKTIIPAFFAKRDRIQAGLSLAVFAIETSISGGTMHAVDAAKIMGRPIFVPDPKAARYADMDEKAIEGTLHLYKEKLATRYTAENYSSIGKQLRDLLSNPEKSSKTDRLL